MRKERLELSRVSPLGPKPSASTSSATFARAVRFRTGRMPHTFGRALGCLDYSRCHQAPPPAPVVRHASAAPAGSTARRGAGSVAPRPVVAPPGVGPDFSDSQGTSLESMSYVQFDACSLLLSRAVSTLHCPLAGRASMLHPAFCLQRMGTVTLRTERPRWLLSRRTATGIVTAVLIDTVLIGCGNAEHTGVFDPLRPRSHQRAASAGFRRIDRVVGRVHERARRSADVYRCPCADSDYLPGAGNVRSHGPAAGSIWSE